MSKKVYTCPDCGHVFSSEVSQLIESKRRVFCEQCGAPFSLKKETIERTEIPAPSKKITTGETAEKNSILYKSIIGLNKISFVPIIILSVLFIIFTFVNLRLFLLGIVGLVIAIYDIIYIGPKLRNRDYNLVVLDAFCLGIMGCLIYGTGVLILIKGVLVIIFNVTNPKNKDRKYYDFGIELKNSLNNFSALAGFLIIILAFYSIFTVSIRTPPIVLFTLFIISGISLLIDLVQKNKIKKKLKIDVLDFLGIFSLGVLGCLFFAAGIFILLKGIICFFLLFGEPSKIDSFEKEAEISIQESQKPEVIPSKKPLEKIETFQEKSEPVEIQKTILTTESLEKTEKQVVEKIPEEKRESEKSQEIEIKLHDSLLPVKDEQDKELVKEYFSKIFSVLSKDLKQKISEINIPNEEKKELLNELAFLSQEEQAKHIEAIISLYQEQIPKKLIERIKKLPNIMPEHYKKIAEQLRFMDFDEQLRYVQYLEKKA